MCFPGDVKTLIKYAFKDPQNHILRQIYLLSVKAFTDIPCDCLHASVRAVSSAACDSEAGSGSVINVSCAVTTEYQLNSALFLSCVMLIHPQIVQSQDLTVLLHGNQVWGNKSQLFCNIIVMEISPSSAVGRRV